MKENFSKDEAKILANVQKRMRGATPNDKSGLKSLPILILAIGFSVPLLLWLSTKSPWIFRLLLETQHPAKAQSAQVPDPAPAAQKLVIKGLYLGMPISTLPSIVTEKFGGDWKISENSSGNQYEVYSQKLRLRAVSPQGRISKFQEVLVQCDSLGMITSFRIDPGATDDLFNTKSLNGDQFVQTFIDSYDIPHIDGYNGYWELITNNVRIVITTEKEIYVDLVPSMSQVKQSFN
jgi:hypothetical protein